MLTPICMGTQSCRLVRRVSVTEELGRLAVFQAPPRLGEWMGSASDRVRNPRLGMFRCTGAKCTPLLECPMSLGLQRHL